MNAAALFERVWKAYGDAQYYRDRGRVESTRGCHAEFETRYKVGDGVSFRFRRILADGSDGLRRSYRIRNDLSLEIEGEEPCPLPVLIARLTGVTFGTAQTVPRLLLGRAIPGRLLGSSPSARLVSTEVVGDRECFRIDDGPPDRPNEIVFVDVHDFAVRRVVEELTFTGAALRDAARARGIDLDKLSPATQTTSYEPEWVDDEAT